MSIRSYFPIKLLHFVNDQKCVDIEVLPKEEVFILNKLPSDIWSIVQMFNTSTVPVLCISVHLK